MPPRTLRDRPEPPPPVTEAGPTTTHDVNGEGEEEGEIVIADDLAEEVDPSNKHLPPVDDEEEQANRYALELLTGQAEPDIRTNLSRFTGKQLSRAALAAGRARRIEPGTLALCAAFQTEQWGAAMAALKDIYDAPKPVWREVNTLATRELDWLLVGVDSAEFLQDVMGLPGGA